METIRILLPIIWAFVAALLGWFLYRYSTAKFETKWVLFTGAAGIAAVCFYGLYRVTPPSFRSCVGSGDVVVSKIEMTNVSDLALQMQQQLDNVRSACMSMPRRDDRCEEELTALEAQGIGIAHAAKNMPSAK